MNNKRTGKFYRKNEAEVMKSLGLVPTKNSGRRDADETKRKLWA